MSENVSSESNHSSSNITLSASGVWAACEFNVVGLVKVYVIAAVNCFHIFILSKLSKISVTPNLKILIVMSVDDIGVCLLRSVKYFCVYEYFQYMIEIPMTYYVYTLLGTLWFALVNLRFFILAAASYDRYIAICKPFKHLNNLCLRYIVTVLLLLFSFLFVTYITATLVAHHFHSAVIDQEQVALYLWPISITIAVLPAAVFTILVMRELKKLHSSGPQYSNASYTRTVVKTTNLILAIILLFLVCLVPPFITHTITQTTDIIQDKTAAIEYTNLIFELYRQFNVIIYGIMNKAFQREVGKLTRCLP